MGGGASGLEISWAVEGEDIRPEPGKCCSASSYRVPDLDLNTGELTETKSCCTIMPSSYPKGPQK